MRRAKRKAAAQGRTLTELIEDGVRRVLSDTGPSKERKRTLPRVSTAGGGLRPGIDLNNSAALQEMDDLDYIARMK